MAVSVPVRYRLTRKSQRPEKTRNQFQARTNLDLLAKATVMDLAPRAAAQKDERLYAPAA